ncbi:unnamed protein product [Pleuronectes platessa]|uniref:Transcription factor BTF3 n=1 Tax=Pleuronectes platessa TaxID=8262 RepID=A0A9N7VX41_PLEPL|nr:unnamed protein product [Pleuronectes platessa]
MVHSDLKPDNVMLVNHEREPFRVKLMDFGGSFMTSVDTRCSSHTQGYSEFERGPGIQAKEWVGDIRSLDDLVTPYHSQRTQAQLLVTPVTGMKTWIPHGRRLQTLMLQRNHLRDEAQETELCEETHPARVSSLKRMRTFLGRVVNRVSLQVSEELSIPSSLHSFPPSRRQEMKEAIMNQEKLAKLQAQVRIGGKGSARRKKKVVHRTATADDKKLQFSLKKLGVNNISGIEEVNMFTNQGTVIHFNNPKVQASLAANTFTITGHAETKQLTEMLPGILNQLGADSLTSLRRLAEALPKQATDGKALIATVEEEDEDDDVPDLVENFDEASKDEAN